jgi:hypothetical protein
MAASIFAPPRRRLIPLSRLSPARLRLAPPKILSQRFRQPLFAFCVTFAHGRPDSESRRFWASRLDKEGALWP